MEKIDIAIIGGGAAGLFLANSVSMEYKTVLFERGERVGKKLSSTGNGQGNVTNLSANSTEYFSVQGDRDNLVKEIICRYDQTHLDAFFCGLGILLSADERGRVYPAGRQASALTDALRFGVEKRGVDVRLSSRVIRLKREKDGFLLTVEIGAEKETRTYFAKKIVLCTGGKAAKNFGTDGSAYALAESLGHRITPVYPSLVQLKTDTTFIKTLKGIRINGGGLTACMPSGEKVSLQGDIIFTDYGVSGDAVFRISAFLAEKISEGVTLLLDFLPNVTEEKIIEMMEKKRNAFPSLGEGELLFGVLNNQVGRAVMKRANGDLSLASKLVKNFPLNVTGSLGFDYAQVTKGGIPLSEVDETLQSRLVKDLYFAGELLDVDGQCGGFNLQWAYSSAMLVAENL